MRDRNGEVNLASSERLLEVWADSDVVGGTFAHMSKCCGEETSCCFAKKSIGGCPDNGHTCAGIHNLTIQRTARTNREGEYAASGPLALDTSSQHRVQICDECPA